MRRSVGSRRARYTKGVTVRWWEGLLGVSGFALALLFLVAGELVAAVVLAALVAFTLAHRAQVAERELAGDYARRRAYLGLVETAALFSIYVVICALFVVIEIDHWTSDTHGTVAMYALAGLAFLLLRELQRYGDEAVNWLLGSREEMRVGQELEPLREQGWFVTHNLKMD
jgi:hypothetical protein